MQNLEEKVAAMDARSEALEIKYTAATRTVEALKASIQTLFEKIGCSTPATRELLGSTGVTESNVLQYLALIEQRSCELLRLFLHRRARLGPPAVQEEASEARTASVQQQGAAPASAFVVELPSAAEDFDASDDSSEEEDDERPLTREELTARMARRQERQAARAARHGGRRK